MGEKIDILKKIWIHFEKKDIQMGKNYNGYCMNFTNEEIENYLLERVNKESALKAKYLSEEGKQIDIPTGIKIDTIVFDEEENISIMFLGCQTSVFVYNEEFMFIDEKFRESYTSSDVYGNVVYEGELRAKSHEQMLEMFADIILCLADAIKLHVIQSDVPGNIYKSYRYYEPHIYVVNVENSHKHKKQKVFENITINY